MNISNAAVETQYQADVSFADEHVFLTDPKANSKFKEVFAESLREAKTHEGHWQYVRAIMKPYVENTLCRALPDVGYWKKDFKAEFKSILSTIKTHANNNCSS